MTDPDLTRRRAVTGAVVGGLSLPVLAACGGGSSSSTASQPPGSSGGGNGNGNGNGSSSSGAGAPALVAADQVPVQGGVILRDQNIVVTQPTQGTFEGFNATCTHQGCQVSSVAGGTINCGCHGSQFAITDGANVTGPSGSPGGTIPPLGKVPVKVQGKNVVQG